MFIETLFPAAEMWPPVTLMAVDEIERFAPGIEVELDDDTTLAEALDIVGGLAAYCRRERERLKKLGLST